LRVVTVTANAAVDATYLLRRFDVGGVNSVAETIAGPGGKGNNVARILAHLGREVVATGFLGGHTGAFIAAELARRGIAADFEPTAGESRRCLTLVDQASGTVTELREPGLPVDADAAGRLVARVVRHAARADAVALCGSLPPGTPVDLYATLIAALRPLPAMVALDAAGDALRLGLAAGPHLIAPNASEMAGLMGVEAGTESAVAFARHDLLARRMPPGARVLLKQGSEGAVLVDRSWVVRAVPPRIDAANPVGSGDALLAGFLAAGAGRADPAADLAFAVAVGTAAALNEATGEVDPDDVARIRAQVRVDWMAGMPRREMVT
jgi:tagatose 6-phosphate kinase